MDQVPTTDALSRASFQSNSTTTASDRATEEPIVRKPSGAFEIKFLLDRDLANRVAEQAVKYLPPDIHAEPDIGNGYRVSSLYFDTPQLDVFWQNGIWRRSKFRLRRYGSSSIIFAERKSKRGGLVTKRRYEIQESEIPMLAREACDENWQAAWYHHRIRSRNLTPTMRICYDRLALTNVNQHGPVRFTVDRNLRYLSTSSFDLSPLVEYRTLLDNSAIVEMKFRESMPSFFKHMLVEFGLNPTSVSKYRLSVADCELDRREQAV
jgi:VTC domain